MKKKKKEAPLYDDNGHWVQERSRIKGAVRRAFRLSPQMKEVMKAARVELPPALKKDGTPGKRPQVRYKCAMCRELFSQKNVNVDHIIPVVPLWIKESNMSYDEIVRGVFCKKDNLQVVCSIPIKRNGGLWSCHKKKSDEENFVRRELDKRHPGSSKTREVLMIEISMEYGSYLEAKEAEKVAKAERKIAREEKRKAKLAKGKK